MTALTRNPTNKDLLQSTKYRLTFTRLPGVTFFCQVINLPGLSTGEAMYPTPFIDLYTPGDKLSYDLLNVTFLLDEDLRDWEQLHDWIRGMTFPKEFKEYVDLKRLSATAAQRAANKLPPQYTDASLTIYTNKNNPNIRINFKDLFPTSLTGIMFNAADTADNILTADATFRFSYYDIERI